MTSVRRLGPSDAPETYALRLRALKEHPEAFGSSYEDEQELGLETWAKTGFDSDENRVFFGAFFGTKLMGMARLARETRTKVAHRAGIYAMYVSPEARNTGAGQCLVAACIGYARELSGVRVIDISCSVGNQAARRLYRRNGFVTWGIQADYFVLADGRVLDLECMSLTL